LRKASALFFIAGVLVFATGSAGAAEDNVDKGEQNRRTVLALNGKNAAVSLEARNKLFAVRFAKLKPLLPKVIKAVRDGSHDNDHAYQLLSLLGPDCGDVLPTILKEIRAEKDPQRRRALVILVGRLGSSAKKGVRELQIMQRDDRDAGVRSTTPKTISRINYSAEKSTEALRLLKLKKYASVKEHRAAWTAIEDVQKHGGVSVELIHELTRWTLLRASRRKPPILPETSAFYEYGPGVLRIAMPVIKRALEGKDEKMRAAALELLARPARLPRYSAWYAHHELVKLLESPKPALRRETATKLAEIRKRIPKAWLTTHPIETAVPKLRKAWFKEKDMSVAKACREALEVFKAKKAPPDEKPKKSVRSK